MVLQQLDNVMSKVQPATNSSCLGIQYQIVPNSSAKNPQDVAIAARSIIDRAAMYLKWPSRNDSSFDVLLSGHLDGSKKRIGYHDIAD